MAMCMIVGLHYFSNAKANEVLDCHTNNYYLYHILESLCICGVNIFVLITGYFSIKQDSIKLQKIVSLLIDVAFWGVLGYCLSILVGGNELDIKEIVKVSFPILFNNRWFVKAYIILLLFAPFINKLLTLLSKKSYKYLLLITIVLFCIWPSFLPYPPIDDYGYGFVHFIFLYILAGYISRFVEIKRWSCNKLLLFFTLDLIIISFSSLYLNMTWAYNYVFVIIGAIALFLLFLRIRIKSKFINVLASCSFGVFLIHTSHFFGPLIYGRVFRVSESLSYSPLLLFLNFIVCIPFFYLFSFVLEYAKKKMFSYSIDVYLRKIRDIHI